MGYELAEQFDWQLPDAIFYPCGGGVGLIGMWKAFAEMEALGWIGPQRPKMIAVQAGGCQPITRAFETRRNERVLARCPYRRKRPARSQSRSAIFLSCERCVKAAARPSPSLTKK